MLIGSLFSGIGGLELGLEWAGLGTVAWQVEIDPFARGVLAKHWPHAKRFDDVRTCTALPPVDLICGGFPCQGLSAAGLRRGLADERSGLWSEFARIVADLSPRFVVAENVPRLATAGMDRVVRDLDALGYCVHGGIVAAADVGAPHERKRLFLVAHSDRDGRGARRTRDDGSRARTEAAFRNDAHGRDPLVADTHGAPVRDERGGREPGRSGAPLAGDAHAGSAQSGVGGSAHGVPARVDRWPTPPGASPEAWEPARSVVVKDRKRALRLRALGNSVVPQVAYQVGLFVRELECRS